MERDPLNQHLPTNTLLGKLSAIEMIDWYDRPRLLIAENAAGHRYIAFWADETKRGNRWLYASASDARIDSLISGLVPLRRIYTEPEDEFIFLVDSPHAAPASVDVITAAAIEPELLPPPDDFLTVQAGFDGGKPDAAKTADRLIHGITIHRPRSSKVVTFESLASVAAGWGKLVQSGLNESPIAVDASANPLEFVLQTDAGPKLPDLLHRLQALIASPTPEQIQTSLPPQECKLLALLLETLHTDKLTLSIKLDVNSASPALVLSHSVTKALRAALNDFNQRRVGPADVPQADDLNKLFRMLELIKAGESNLSYLLELSPRHMSYYRQAARILDLLGLNDAITSRGDYLVSLSHLVERYEIAMMLFESSPVGLAWLRYGDAQTAMDLEPESSTDFLNAQSTDLSAATIGRRAQTLRYWVQTFREQLA
jgi:hypothetical protein